MVPRVAVAVEQQNVSRAVEIVRQASVEVERQAAEAADVPVVSDEELTRAALEAGPPPA